MVDVLRALGLVETIGLNAATEAANVELLTKRQAGGGLITINVNGDVGAVKAAVDAGRAAAEKVGKVHSSQLIPRPHTDIANILERPPIR